jgi:hypothetical protein
MSLALRDASGRFLRTAKPGARRKACLAPDPGLNRMIDAIREILDMEPILRPDMSTARTTLERFYVVPYEWPTASTLKPPKRHA